MRKLDNWLEAYEAYTKDTESNPLFNRWVGLSLLASALRKKTWLELGRLKVFPNLYVVLVANPGLARKSQAISYGTDILNAVPAVITSADSITPQALIQDIEDATTYDMLPNGRALRHASLSIISKEFESFLGQAGSSTKMLVTLTDLFDAGESPWKHRTKGSGTSTIPSVYLNILGATTPQSLASCLSALSIGGGLTSRILFVYSDTKTKKIAIPTWDKSLVELKEKLTHDLNIIASMSGEFTFTESSKAYWIKWYESYDEMSKKRIQPRYEFDGWYSRKPLMVQKVALLLSAARSSYREISVADIEQAIGLIEEVEKGMGGIFNIPFKKQDVRNPQIDVLLGYIKQYKNIAEKHLLQLVWRDIDVSCFESYIEILLDEEKCVRKFESPTGKEEIWYSIKEENNDN